MAQRRSPHRGLSAGTESRRYAFRRSPPQRRAAIYRATSSSTSHASVASTELSRHSRPVLVPLHPNLRRLPSRLYTGEKDIAMRDTGHSYIALRAGSKRKRVASNENALTGSRPAYGSGRYKRHRMEAVNHRDCNTDDMETSSMDVDTSTRWSVSDESSEENEHDVDEAEDSSDDHLINSAPPNQLQRLRKDELVRLYISAGLVEDAETLTKHEIIDAIIAAREDVAELPPSSPPGHDGNTSDYSSDDGNIAGDEQTDVGGQTSRRIGIGLRRRATFNDLGRLNGQTIKNRSLSMGHLNNYETSLECRKPTKGSYKSTGRHISSRSPPTSFNCPPSPLATRTRSRKVSAPVQPLTPVSPTSGSSMKGTSHVLKSKGKVKQVEFSNEVDVRPHSSSKRSIRSRERQRLQEKHKLATEESELTDLDEIDNELKTSSRSQPSPRRLRSTDKVNTKAAENGFVPVTGGRKQKHNNGAEFLAIEPRRRVIPMRKAKDKIGSLRETDGEDDEDESESDGQEESDEELADSDENDTAGEVKYDEDSQAGSSDDEEEVDELISSRSASPPSSGRRTPVRRRLRPRRVQTFTPPSDGDDEESAEEDSQHGEPPEEEVSGDENSGANDGETIAVEPRRLRNGKIVGEEDVEMDHESAEDEDESEEPDEDTERETSVSEDAESVNLDVDAEGDTDEDEPMEEEVDLTVATAKTLVRLRRDDLVRLCECRDLDVAGTKPQLAEALLQWRDRQINDFSSPSSTGTIRPSSTVKRRKHQRHGKTGQPPSTPVLMRSDRVHIDEPRTPPLSKDSKDTEPDLELDLESLGLEDREIPPDKLTKLEKIGSGGFKDVFIGKLKGRKIAISEFRGQLSTMDIKELKLLGGFDHPNIVRFLGVSIPENTKETPVMIVSELCSNGDLFDYIRNTTAPTLHKVLCMMLDIARGLEYLHTRKPSIIHRDCKSSNILITAKGTAKIADFGLAKVKQSTRSMVRSLVGTVNWQAPELWHAHPKYNHKVDVFSCAMVYWEMLQWHLSNKKFPWEGMNEHAIYEIVGAKRQRPSISGLRKQWCPEIVDLIERMWAQDHQDRPTMTEVVDTLEELVRTH